MNVPVSFFIMDVTNSSSAENREELTLYLDELVEWISVWTKGILTQKSKHRSGDEIIFAGEGYSTAYILAFYIKNIWKFPGHGPYFGLSFGDIDRNLDGVDIERWIHPLIKQARYANDLQKKVQKNRPPFKFELDQFILEKDITRFNYHDFRFEFEILINSLLNLQHHYIRNQTDIQKLVCSLYLIFNQQKLVAKRLGKTAPTISSHFYKGQCEQILATFDHLVKVLNSLQKKMYKESENASEETALKLEQAIRSHVNMNIGSVFAIDMNI